MAAATVALLTRRRGLGASGPAIGNPYYDRNLVIVQQRLAAAGIRLATLLNDIYASDAAAAARWALSMSSMERSLY